MTLSGVDICWPQAGHRSLKYDSLVGPELQLVSKKDNERGQPHNVVRAVTERCAGPGGGGGQRGGRKAPKEMSLKPSGEVAERHC